MAFAEISKNGTLVRRMHEPDEKAGFKVGDAFALCKAPGAATPEDQLIILVTGNTPVDPGVAARARSR